MPCCSSCSSKICWLLPVNTFPSYSIVTLCSLSAALARSPPLCLRHKGAAVCRQHFHRIAHANNAAVARDHILAEIDVAVVGGTEFCSVLSGSPLGCLRPRSVLTVVSTQRLQGFTRSNMTSPTRITCQPSSAQADAPLTTRLGRNCSSLMLPGQRCCRSLNEAWLISR